MGGSCGDDGSIVEVWVLGISVSISPVVVFSGGTVCSARGASWDGFINSDGPGISCSGGDRIPKCCCICLRMAVCLVWVAISWSWCASMAAIYWTRMLWVVVNVCKVWHRPLNFEIDMEILNSDGWGIDAAGTTGEVPVVVRGAEDVTSSVSPVEGIARAGAMISVGISACCACCGCYGSSSCGISGCSSPTKAPGCAT